MFRLPTVINVVEPGEVRSMQMLQKIPRTFIRQQKISKRTYHAFFLPLILKNVRLSLALNSHPHADHQGSAGSLRFLHSGTQLHKAHHLRSETLLSMSSSCPTPLARSTSKTSTSRISSSPTLHVTEPCSISIEEFHRLSDAFIDTLVLKLEALQEEREEVDVEYSAGVLNLLFPPVGTYVLNKQPPNKQIWLSSPVSGPKRYDWVEATSSKKGGKWVYLRDGSTLDRLLVEEIGISSEDD